ncbi:serpin family protein [Spirosoma spitsbergense]|jgi:serine protease inhibitor|uniref:serpin family protein n=1 Tax=Spirosoma spitsbergense TaxID=431554 RepID=UPI00036CE199|nr:serpin family protein [Spirosoma spitsbergense]
MRTTLFSNTIICFASILLAAISCKSTSVNPNPGSGTASELRVSAPFADQTTQFAFDVAKRVVAQEGQAKNVFISPLSLHIALGMILNGANGQTAQEIQKALKLDAQTLAEANTTYQNLLENLPGVDPSVTLTLANSVWYRNTYQVETTFQDLLKQTFKAQVSAQDFNDPATVAKINSWASEQTKGRIPKVIDQIQPDNIMFLLNALYFKGDWQKPFDPNLTSDSPFKLASGGSTLVRMMRLDVNLNHFFQTNYQAIELPYGTGKFAMTVLLPSESTTADALIASLNSAEWAKIQKGMIMGKMDIGLPKFTLNYEVRLNSVLSDMGMPTAFTDQADFTKINNKGGLTLSFVKQNTFVAVDEKGTEAAAVTSVGVTTTALQLPTLIDRPFAFIIHEKTTGTILFIGKIADPTKTNS